MGELTAPMEVLDLKDGDSLTFTAERWEEGETTIRPAHLPQGKVVTVLRVHVPAAEKKAFPPWYDLTAKGVQAQIKPFLERGIRGPYKITKHGIQPKARFTVELLGGGA